MIQDDKHRTPSPTPPSQPAGKSSYPLPVGEEFTRTATRLAGFAGALLGWRPDEFWRATPVELETILGAMAAPDDVAADGTLIARLKEQFPDG